MRSPRPTLTCPERRKLERWCRSGPAPGAPRETLRSVPLQQYYNARRARLVTAPQHFDFLAGSTGLEPATSGLTVQCANQAAPRARANGNVAPDRRDTRPSSYHAGPTGSTRGGAWDNDAVMRGMLSSVEPFDDDSAGPAVHGFLHRPAGPVNRGLVLAHGAGSDCDAPVLVAVAEAFARAGLAVLRCDLPFRQARASGPPPPASAARDREGLRRAVTALRTFVPGPIALGGHSYGGRQASMVAADDAGLVDALLLLSYPLHPPRRPHQRRVQHFPALHTPVLFVHG